MMISCGSGAIEKEECDVVVYGREVASVDAPSLSATPLVMVMVMVMVCHGRQEVSRPPGNDAKGGKKRHSTKNSGK